jgi:predicted Zn-dependent protease
VNRPAPATGQSRDLAARLNRIEQLLARDPAQAAKQAALLLAEVPGQPMAMLFQGIAHRLLNEPGEAIRILDSVSSRWPEAPLPHLQRGLALREMGQDERAEEAMRRAVAIKQDFSDAWLALADLLVSMGKAEAADAAFSSYVRFSGTDAALAMAARAIQEKRYADAEPVLRARIEQHPTDVAALCLLADVLAQNGILNDAETLLTRCLSLAPGYRAARQNLAVLLTRQNRPTDALQECDRLLADTPDDAGVLNVKANVFRRMGEYQECIGIYRRSLGIDPAQQTVWTSLGHTLRALGQKDESIDAYRKSIAAAPRFGQPWWSLASIKPSPLTDADVAVMRQHLEVRDLAAEDRIHLHFAVGRALEERRAFAEAFHHYAEGNRLCHDTANYDAAELTRLVERSKALFTPAFFAERTGSGDPAADPIFIVGLPRSGSTLVEQILSSHTLVEGTTELPDIVAMVRLLDERVPGTLAGKYPDVLEGLEAERFRTLGESYLQQTRVQRKRGTSFFIDKMPNNFAHVGFIQLILPNARIIDVRRHPMACGFSLFKLLFGHGQHFAYSLEDIGRYYRDYVELMAHYDTVLPGRVYRVIYENLVANTEAEVRRLLDYCRLQYEPACLTFYETRRPVNTPSAEQVRSPIFREGLEQWRHFEPWLEPLRQTLGALADRYPFLT